MDNDWKKNIINTCLFVTQFKWSSSVNVGNNGELQRPSAEAAGSPWTRSGRWGAKDLWAQQRLFFFLFFKITISSDSHEYALFFFFISVAGESQRTVQQEGLVSRLMVYVEIEDSSDVKRFQIRQGGGWARQTCTWLRVHSRHLLHGGKEAHVATSLLLSHWTFDSS